MGFIWVLWGVDVAFIRALVGFDVCPGWVLFGLYLGCIGNSIGVLVVF